MGDRLLDELVGVVDVPERLLQVDDVDAVALGEDESLHLRVPATGLVPEVDAAVEQLLHADDCHCSLSALRAADGPRILGCRGHRVVRRPGVQRRHAPGGCPLGPRWRLPRRRREEDARSRPVGTGRTGQHTRGFRGRFPSGRGRPQIRRAPHRRAPSESRVGRMRARVLALLLIVVRRCLAPRRAGGRPRRRPGRPRSGRAPLDGALTVTRPFDPLPHPYAAGPPRRGPGGRPGLAGAARPATASVVFAGMVAGRPVVSIDHAGRPADDVRAGGAVGRAPGRRGAGLSHRDAGRRPRRLPGPRRACTGACAGARPTWIRWRCSARRGSGCCRIG